MASVLFLLPKLQGLEVHSPPLLLSHQGKIFHLEFDLKIYTFNPLLFHSQTHQTHAEIYIC